MFKIYLKLLHSKYDLYKVRFFLKLLVCGAIFSGICCVSQSKMDHVPALMLFRIAEPTIN
jgi:hypothetical protein